MKKKTIAICGAVTAAVVLAVTVGILLPRSDKTASADVSVNEATASTVETAVSVPDEIGTDFDAAAVSEIDVSDVDSLLTIDDPEPASSASSKPSVSREAAKEPAKPIAVKTPADDSNSGGVVIGGAQSSSSGKYDCGTPGHHCAGPETHAYLLNLELEGCPYCGKHDCPSFYAVDEWGNTCYTPSKCPEYDAHKDPVYYCQTCGRKCGDGSGETCVQFVNACNCPNCGKRVEARTCHNCK